MAAQITNVTRYAWSASAAHVDPLGTIWLGGEDLPHPRVVVLEADPAYRPLFANVTDSGGRTFVTLTAYDPFRSLRVPCEGCFVDEVEIAWPGDVDAPRFVLVNLTAQGGTAAPAVMYEAANDVHVARFRNLTPSEAHGLYAVTLERLP
jgi:hypothetical protein